MTLPVPTLTHWTSLRTTTGKRIAVPWSDVFAAMRTPRPWSADLHPGWSAAAFDGDARSLDSVRVVFALVLDVDGSWSLDDSLGQLESYYGLVHTTKSHTPEVHRYRIILPLSRPVSRFEYAALWRRFDCEHPGRFDPQAKDASRFWFLPASLDGTPYHVVELSGEPLDVDAWLAKPEPRTPAPLPPMTQSRTDAEARARAYVAAMPEAISGDSGHTSLWDVTLAMVRGFGLAPAVALDILRSEYNPRCLPAWSEKELEHKVRDATNARGVGHGYLLAQRPEFEPRYRDEPSPPLPPADDTAPDEPAWRKHGFVTFADGLRDLQTRIASDTPTQAWPTGHWQLDRLLGGYRPGHVTVVGAPTNWGKSSFAVMAADECMLAGGRVLLVSAEDTVATYSKRITARRLGMSALALRNEQLDERERDRFDRFVDAAHGCPWFFSAIGRTVEVTVRAVQEVCAQDPYDLIIVDYLQAFRAGKRTQDRRNEITLIARLWTDAIKSSGAAGLLLSQLKRTEVSEPGMHDIKESGDVENGAEHVLVGFSRVERETATHGEINHRMIKLEKNKDGPKSTGAIELPWHDISASFLRCER